MKRSSIASAAVLGLCIGGGVALAGLYLGLSLKESRRPQRSVSVRGLAEREVDADLAVWPITFAETGNVLAALLGVVTPFCSCSAVPLFIGFVTTGVPLGVTFSFLISAPMVLRY